MGFLMTVRRSTNGSRCWGSGWRTSRSPGSSQGAPDDRGHERAWGKPDLPASLGLEVDGEVTVKPFCTPWYASMEEAAHAFIDLKYGEDGTHNDGYSGSWLDTAEVQRESIATRRRTSTQSRPTSSTSMGGMGSFLASRAAPVLDGFSAHQSTSTSTTVSTSRALIPVVTASTSPAGTGGEGGGRLARPLRGSAGDFFRLVHRREWPASVIVTARAPGMRERSPRARRAWPNRRRHRRASRALDRRVLLAGIDPGLPFEQQRAEGPRVPRK